MLLLFTKDPSMWDTFKIPVIVIVGIAAVVLILLLLRRGENAHAQQAEELARGNGWTFSRKDELGLAARIESILPGQRFFAYNIRQVRTEQPRIFLFDCEHRAYERQRNSVSSTGCLAELGCADSGRSVVDIVPFNYLDAQLLSAVVDLGDDAFGKEFNVLCADVATAKRVVTHDIRQRLLTEMKHNSQEYLRLVIGPDEVLLLRGSRNLLEEDHALKELIQLTQAIAGDLARLSH